MNFLPASTRHVGERGQALIIVVLLLAVLLGITALVVDLGSYTGDRRSLQNAADAIALAASQELPNSANAQAAANSWATKNDINTSNMTVTIVPQNPPSIPNPQVKVTLTRTHNFTFARVLGVSSSNVSVTATGIRTSPGGVTALVPWSVTRPVLTSVPPGEVATLKYDSNGVTSGNFGAIRIDGSGANIYRDSASLGSNGGLCALGVTGCPYSSTAEAETGNMVGATKTAVDYRISNTSTACDTWAEVTLVQNGLTTLNPTCNPFIAGGDPNSLRIIVIPVVASLCNGSCTMTITEFALFFLEGYDSGGCNGSHCNIQGRFIQSNVNYGAVVGVFDPNTLSHFVRLVQ